MKPSASPWLAHLRSLVIDALPVYLQLLKVLIPAIVVVKLLDMLGAIDVLGGLLSPVVSLVGLPDWAGVVWAATLLTNIFTGMVLFFELSGDTPMSVAQVTVLGALMLIGHSLPVEGAVAHRAGVPWSATITLRVGGALVLAAILHATYTAFDWLQEPARSLWVPEADQGNAGFWLLDQLKALGMIFIIILLLMGMLRLLHHLGAERLIHLALSPLLRTLGIGQSAANVTVIGVLLGLTYGAGLVIRDVETGTMTRRDSALALCFLGLLHSVIEDTLLVMALGAHLSGILWARLIFAVVVIALLARCLPRSGLPEQMSKSSQ